MPDDIKQSLKNYEEKQELLKRKLEEARARTAAAASVGKQRPNEPGGEPKKTKMQVTPEKGIRKESEGYESERSLENVDKRWQQN